MIALLADEAKLLGAALDELELLLRRRGAPPEITGVLRRALPAEAGVLPTTPGDVPLGVTAMDVALLLDGLSLAASMLANPKESTFDAMRRLSDRARFAAQAMGQCLS